MRTRSTPPPSRPRELAERVALRVGAAHGFRYGPLPAEVEMALPGWVAGAPLGGEPLKQDRIHRQGAVVVKRFPRLARWRLGAASQALRAAEQHARLLPLPSPRPLVALTGVAGGGGLLVSEFVEGRLLQEVWGAEDGEPARRALPPLMAALHERHVLHGDLHPRNLLWTGSELLLLDMEAVRHGLHRLRERRIALQSWARFLVYLGDEPGVRAAFEDYCGRPGALFAAADWGRIAEEARALLRRRPRLPPISAHLLADDRADGR